MKALSVITSKQKRMTWLRAFRIWQRRPYELAPLSEATHKCASCGTEYQGNYCPRCGQSAKIGRFSFKKAILLFLDVWGIGNRGMFRSIRDLMLRPGYMIRDYLRGMQSAYFPPFKMFFLLAALSFVVEHGFSLLPSEESEDGQSKQEVITDPEKAAAEAIKNIPADVRADMDSAKVELERLGVEGYHTDRSEGSFKFEFDENEDLNSFQVRFIKAGAKVVKFLNALRKQNTSLFALFSLLFFAAPLYIFFRHAPNIPDLRFSEFVVALVYTSNMYSIYTIIGKVLFIPLLNLLAVLMVFITLKQLSGFSKRRVFFYSILAFAMSVFSIVLLVNIVILIVSYFTSSVA